MRLSSVKKSLFLSILSLSITTCSLIESVSAPIAPGPMSKIDSLYIGLPVLTGHQSLSVCVKDYDKFLNKIPQSNHREGLVKTRLAIGSDGKLLGVKALETVAPEQDSIALSILLETEFQPSYIMEGIKGNYAVDLIFPFVQTNHNDLEYEYWITLPPEEQMFHSPPEPLGGYAYIQKSVEYPKLARELDIQGTVEIKLFIDSSGRMGHFEVWKSMGYGMDWAAIAAIKQAEWAPAKRNMKPVPSSIIVPVIFKWIYD